MGKSNLDKGAVENSEDTKLGGKLAVDKGKDKITHINKDTVYLEDVMKPR